MAGLGHRREERWSEPQSVTEGLRKVEETCGQAPRRGQETRAERGSQRRLLAPVRMNFCEEPEWLAFRIVDGRVAWETPTDGESLSSCIENPIREKAVVLHEVMDWLREELKDEDQSASSMRERARENGYSQATLRRACKKVKVRHIRREFGPIGHWRWTLKPPPSEDEAGNGGAPAERSHSKPRRERRPKRSRTGAARVAELNSRISGKPGKAGKTHLNGDHLSNGGGSNGRPRKPR